MLARLTPSVPDTSHTSSSISEMCITVVSMDQGQICRHHRAEGVNNSKDIHLIRRISMALANCSTGKIS